MNNYIIELDKKESISKKELARYLFLNDRNTAKGLMELYSTGIIDKKPLDKKSYDKNGVNANEENKSVNDFNHNIEISLTPHGKELASNIKEIDVKWEELIYKNLEDSNKDEIMKNVKDLAISSLKINKDANVSDADAKISRAKKIFDKMLNTMFNSAHKFRHNFNPRNDCINECRDNFRDIYRDNYRDIHRDNYRDNHRDNYKDNYRDNFKDDFRNDFKHDYKSDCRYYTRNHEMYGPRFDDFNRSRMTEMPHRHSRRFRGRIPDDDAFGFMAFFKARKLRGSWPF